MRKFVYTKLKGGLGNQMFQYAIGKLISIYHDANLELDLSFLSKHNESTENFVARKYELSVFPSINESSFNSERFYNNLNLKRILKTRSFRSVAIINEIESLSLTSLFNSKLPILIDGYWQSELYFKSIRDLLLRLFEFQNLDKNDANIYLLDEIQKNTNSVSIHIRRGDYLNSLAFSYHGVCDLAYYELAVQEIEKNVHSPKYYLFSDDLEWVRINICPLLNHFKLVEGNNGSDSWKDLLLMKNCRNHIIANSSFSWWAAWLNNYQKKIVIAPRNWFKDQEVQNKLKPICPNEWILL